MENSIIENFADGITCAQGGALILSNTEITDCEHGLKVNDGARIKMQSSTIKNCSGYGISYRTDSVDGDKKHIDTLAELEPLLR